MGKVTAEIRSSRPMVLKLSAPGFRSEIGRLKNAGIHFKCLGVDISKTLSFLRPDLVTNLIKEKTNILPHSPLQITLRGVILHEDTLSKIMGFALTKADQYKEDFGPVTIYFDSGKLRVRAETWQGAVETLQEEVAHLQTRVEKLLSARADLETKLNAVNMLDKKLSTAEHMKDIEESFAGVLLEQLGASSVKIYDVDDELVVTSDKMYKIEEGRLVCKTGDAFPSKFSGGLKPHQYPDGIVRIALLQLKDTKILVVPSSDKDPRYSTSSFVPYASLKEEIDGKLRRLYIIEVEDAKKIEGERAITDFIGLIHKRVSQAKTDLLRREEEKIILEIQKAVSLRKSPRKVMEEVVKHIPNLFKTNGSYKIDEVILIRNLPEELKIVGRWLAPGVKETEEELKTGNNLPEKVDGGTSISWIVSRCGQGVRLTSEKEFKDVPGMGWAKNGRGSLLGAPIKKTGLAEEEVMGGIIIRSLRRNAFTEQHEKILSRICNIIGIALVESERLQDRLNRDQKFGVAFSAKYLLEELLPSSIKESRKKGQPLAGIYFDIDHFKSLNTLLTNSIVDEFVLGPFIKFMGGSVREGEPFIRHGGDEFCIFFRNTTSDAAVKAAKRISGVLGNREFEIKIPFGHGEAARKQAEEKLEEIKKAKPGTPPISEVRRVETEIDGYYVEVILKLTLSIGVSAYNYKEKETPEEFLRRIVNAMIEAKKKGRDTIVKV